MRRKKGKKVGEEKYCICTRIHVQWKMCTGTITLYTCSTLRVRNKKSSKKIDERKNKYPNDTKTDTHKINMKK